jgi:hypothetical protein
MAATRLEFSATDLTPMGPRAGIDEEFLAKINATVVDVRNLKRSHPGVGTFIVNLTSPSGEIFEIVVK